MKWSYAAAGVIIIGLFGILIILLFNEITVSNEQDYYTLKDATEAALIDSVDVTYYRLTGEIKICKEKFVENFSKRFISASTFGKGDYQIEFGEIDEYPPKVSVRIIDPTNSYNIFTMFKKDTKATSVRVVNEITAILDGYKPNIEK